jgi:hypothetical protein
MKFQFITITICILSLSCSGQSDNKNAIRKNSRQSTISIRRIDDTTGLILFPFEFKDYNTNRLKKYFSQNTQVDSTERISEGVKSRTYRFFDKSSSLEFFMKPNDKQDPFFYLVSGSFGKGFIKLKEGLDFEMDIKSCFRKLGLAYSDCDTLRLDEGDMSTIYTFIFKSGKLSRIDIITDRPD